MPPGVGYARHRARVNSLVPSGRWARPGSRSYPPSAVGGREPAHRAYPGSEARVSRCSSVAKVFVTSMSVLPTSMSQRNRTGSDPAPSHGQAYPRRAEPSGSARRIATGTVSMVMRFGLAARSDAHTRPRSILLAAAGNPAGRCYRASRCPRGRHVQASRARGGLPRPGGPG